MTKELYKRYRPTELSEVVGQDAVVRTLEDMLKRRTLPHTLLLCGPSGCGKTTIGRILRERLGCSDMDFKEINAASKRGVDDVRKIEAVMGQRPMEGKCRVWLIDECHQLTKEAQSAFLKMLEDTPRHVYFFLATTHPQTLIAAVKNRCSVHKINPVPDADIEALVSSVAKAEAIAIGPAVCKKIATAAEGSARRALVVLEKVATAHGDEEINEVIDSANIEGQGIEICRVLFKQGATWRDMAAVLSTVNEEPEGLRRAVLGYAAAVLLKSGNPRAFKVINEFERNYFDTNKAGLVASCFACFSK